MNLIIIILLLAGCNELLSFRCSLRYGSRIMKLRYNHPNPFRQYDKETAKRVFNHTSPAPGAPVIYLRLEKDDLAYIKLIVSKEATANAFNESCTKFKKELENVDFKPKGFGFLKKANYTDAEVCKRVGLENVKKFSGNLMAKAIATECMITGLPLLGIPRIVDFDTDKFIPGEPMSLTVEYSLLPPIQYTNSYKTLNITLSRDPEEIEKKIDKIRMNILDKYRVVEDVLDLEYRAKKGDTIIAKVQGYFLNADGSRGGIVYEGNTGDRVELILNPHRCIPELVDYLCGARVGDTFTVPVQFHKHAGPVFGQKASFDVEVLGIQKAFVPAWDDALADSEQSGMTIEQLEEDIRGVVHSKETNKNIKLRNEALGDALLAIAQVQHVPKAMKKEAVRKQYLRMIESYRKQGKTEAELARMFNEERYAEYSQREFASVDNGLKLSMILKDIARLEGVRLDPEDVESGVRQIKARVKEQEEKGGGGSGAADSAGEAAVSDKSIRESVEDQLERMTVFDLLAAHANITYTEKPEMKVTVHDEGL